MDELGDRSWRHANSEFIVFDFLGNSDEHGGDLLDPDGAIMAPSRRAVKAGM